MQGWGIVFVAIAYLLFLFVVASYGDRRFGKTAHIGTSTRSRNAIYALSLAIYCTSWTFFGSVGLASESGFDFLGIYVGPILMITVGYSLFSHIIAVAKSERITSIADFIASRYGKSAAVGAFAAIIAVLGTVPYIALQLKAISSTVDTMITQVRPSVIALTGAPVDTSFFVSVLLAMFAILFGTRHTDATEHQDGLILAVATESIVKLVAFLAVGLYVTYFLFGGVGDLITKAQNSSFVSATFYGGIHPSKFLVFTLLSFGAFVLLPRQFHVGVVENHSKNEVATARWMFPLYLVLINLFVLPVAIAGMLTFGNSVDADSYVLALPLQHDAWFISFLVFVGGLSAATAMVIVACVALAIMISNNLVLPLILRLKQREETYLNTSKMDMSDQLLAIRRTAIFIILALAYAYFQVAGDSAALAAIGLLSFAAVAQFAPSFFIGFFWRRATSLGAIWGMGVGFSMWIYTLFLPTVLEPNAGILISGPFQIDWLRPQALFGIDAEPLHHGVFFSLLTNTLAYIVASYARKPKAIERMQASIFSFKESVISKTLEREERLVTVEELRNSVSNYLGRERCNRAFDAFFIDKIDGSKENEFASDELITYAEQLLASAVGAASSRLVISLLLQKHTPSEESTIQLLDDASEALQYNRDLLQTAIDQVEQGISVFDKDFRLSSWNRQFRALLDLPTEFGQVGIALSTVCEAIEKNSTSRSPADPEFIVQLLDMGKTSTISLGQSNRIIEVQTNALPNGGLVISWNDVTEKSNAARELTIANETLEKRVQERTEELTKLNADLAAARESAESANLGKTRFLAAVGHDILQPLNAARLYTSSLVEALADSPKRKLAGNVDDALESVEDILGAVLAISRLDAGALTPNKTTFSVERLLKKLEVEFGPIAQNKGLYLKIIPNGLSVVSDYSLLRRLLQNLISNALKYTNEGTVIVDARVRKNTVVFEISDTGPGVSKTDQELMFQEFHRLAAGKKSAPGLGLGLSIVKRLADTLDHPLDVRSQLGRGTVFTVTVPLAVEKQKLARPVKPHSAPEFDLLNLTVICLDNDKTILGGMKTLLGGWGCKVHTFQSSKTMLKQFNKIDVDVLLIDLHLDEENGLDIISRLQSRYDKNIPIVLITADRSADVQEKAKALGVNVMNKPLKPAGLRALFSKIVKGSTLRKGPQAAE